ncbi:MAG: serine/threonine protein phosphatase [Rhodobacteraceae bacterium]|nr:serine/threonine protein phosphatase [Paracoccaceae bacterium]
MPETPVYVVGDIHGRIDLLEILLDRIARDRTAQGWDNSATVFVGDYIDRGQDSAGVLARCIELEADPAVICLMGNHEAMFLDFMSGDGGDASAILWLRNGGRATLESYGAALPIRIDGVEMIDDLRALARARVPGDIVDWVGRRPLLWTSGDVAVCHATPDPLIPLNELPEDELVWGRPKPGMPERCDGFWLVHGHTIVRTPRITGRRINVDTGAFESNILTAAVIAPGAPIRFLDTA